MDWYSLEKSRRGDLWIDINSEVKERRKWIGIVSKSQGEAKVDWYSLESQGVAECGLI